MAFEFVELELKGVYLIKPHIYEDDRGVYKKTFQASIFEEMGLPIKYSESSDIISCRGAIRGLHYQEIDSQAKLIHVINGSLYDVIVDLRKDSITYGKHLEIYLKSFDNLVLFIPADFAHGFMALEDNTVFSYQCSGAYHPNSCGGIRWDDPDLCINWPIKNINELVMTEKDKNWPSLKEVMSRRK